MAFVFIIVFISECPAVPTAFERYAAVGALWDSIWSDPITTDVEKQILDDFGGSAHFHYWDEHGRENNNWDDYWWNYWADKLEVGINMVLEGRK